MILSKIVLIGFRNYENATINLNEKALILGANDIGKTNLIWAIRLLLDRSLSDYDIMPQDNDFYAYEETNEFQITLFFSEVTNDCVVARMKGFIGDDNILLLSYIAKRDPQTNSKEFKLFAGPSVDLLQEIEDRFYRKVLNIKYIRSSRDFSNYIKKEKLLLLQNAKENRTESQIQEDDILYKEIRNDLESIDSKIPNLNFVSSATHQLNSELSKLSIHHKKQKIFFDSSTSELDNLINNISLTSESNGNKILIGGDGRLNQIYLSLWTQRNGLFEDDLSEVSIFCIEEPEAHLHPHQQRKLAEYLNNSLNGQVLLTTHSPQIAAEFSPNSIIRLYADGYSTVAASNGCSKIIEDAFNNFSYRMSIIPAEAFFSDVVLLIEGPSEDIFYKALAKKLSIDIDRMNISILMVNGIGFKTYIKILNSLRINWVVRTDNDIFKIQNTDDGYRMAGVERCISFYRDYCTSDEEMDNLLHEYEPNLRWKGYSIPEIVQNSVRPLAQKLETFNIFLAVKDLEHDLLNSPLKEYLYSFYDTDQSEETISLMQEKKADNMFGFLNRYSDSLSLLNTNSIINPLLRCKSIVEE